MFTSGTYRDAAPHMFGTKVDFAVQVDVTRTPYELKHVEAEGVGRSLSISHRLYCMVTGTRTPAQKQENAY